MVMKMVLAESCGRPHNLVPFVAATEDKKIFAPSSSQYSSFQSLPLAFSPAWGEGVASCYWQSQNHPRLVTSIVLLWASILQPASIISILKLFSAFSIVLLCYIQRYNFLNCQNPRLFGIFRELWTESGSRSGWCKMLREGCEDKKLLLETEFTDCYSAVVSSRLRIKEIQLQQFVVTFLLYWVKPWKILTHACLLCLFHAYFPPWTLQWIIPLEKYDLKRNTRIKQNPICYLHTICISFLDQPLPSPTRSTHPKLQNKEPYKPINKSKLEFLCVKLAFENVN